jgi:hypothetical protein
MPGNRGLDIFISDTLEYIEVKGASCPNNRTTNYIYNWHYRVY